MDALIGARVSVRQRVGERAGRPLYSDSVGDLTHSDDGLVVHTRRGPVRIDPDAVVAVRAVPPAVPKRASLAAVAALETLCADAWPALVDEQLGAWRLRAADGFTGRANAALAIGDPGMPVPAALDAVRAFAARAGIGPRVQAPIDSPWDRAVQRAGWVLDVAHAAGSESAVMVADLDVLAAQPVPLPVELPLRPSDDWFGSPPSSAARHVLDPGGTPTTAFALVRDPDAGVVGRMRACVVADHLHVSVLEVEPAARGRGLGTGLMAAAATWGREQGARWAVLQVALHNTRARALYTRLGMVTHHQYRYLVPESE